MIISAHSAGKQEPCGNYLEKETCRSNSRGHSMYPMALPQLLILPRTFPVLQLKPSTTTHLRMSETVPHHNCTSSQKGTHAEDLDRIQREVWLKKKKGQKNITKAQRNLRDEDGYVNTCRDHAQSLTAEQNPRSMSTLSGSPATQITKTRCWQADTLRIEFVSSEDGFRQN